MGLFPGLLLYWSARPANVVVPTVAPTVLPLPAPTAPVAVPKEPDARPLAPKRSPSTIFDASELARMLGERSDQLKASQSAHADLTRQLRELEAKFDALSQEEGKRKVAENELREQLTAAQREVDSVKIAAQTREATVRDLELKSQEFRKQASETTLKTGRRKQAGTELEEIGRRRESYLNNILGRYREATELFRAMSLRLDNPRDGSSPQNNDLSRIQQAIQLADEDLRQLRVLNAQAARLQKELN